MAGLTTFVTMVYIVVVNPAVLKNAGIPAGPSTVATILTAIMGTLIMGLYANRPFAIAPYMGENAFITFTVVLGLGYSWQSALAAVFVAGVIFLLLTVLRLRQWLVDAIPTTLRYSYAVGIGLFLTFIGLTQTGIVVAASGGPPVHTGNFASKPVLVAIFGFILISVLLIRKFPAAILIGILATAFLAYVTGVSAAPSSWVSLPPSLSPILFKMDFSKIFTIG